MDVSVLADEVYNLFLTSERSAEKMYRPLNSDICPNVYLVNELIVIQKFVCAVS